MTSEVGGNSPDRVGKVRILLVGNSGTSVLSEGCCLPAHGLTSFCACLCLAVKFYPDGPGLHVPLGIGVVRQVAERLLLGISWFTASPQAGYNRQ